MWNWYYNLSVKERLAWVPAVIGQGIWRQVNITLRILSILNTQCGVGYTGETKAQHSLSEAPLMRVPNYCSCLHVNSLFVKSSCRVFHLGVGLNITSIIHGFHCRKPQWWHLGPWNTVEPGFIPKNNIGCVVYGTHQKVIFTFKSFQDPCWDGNHQM